MCHLSRMRIIRRAWLRKELKPVQIFGPDDNFAATWLLIVHEQGRQDFESYTLVFLRPDGAASTWMGFETLMTAKGQAHAEVGVEYVEWEACDIDILDSDNSIHWERGLPSSELHAASGG